MPPRVAFFTDCYHEVNGVALTSRQFAAFAQATERPFLAVCGGRATRRLQSGSLETLELDNSPFRIGVERDLAFDLLFARHLKTATSIAAGFRPDLVHVTSPGHIGLLGALVAHRLGVPLVASWHTNIHEFGARRLDHMIRWLPDAWRRPAVQAAENAMLSQVLQLYGRARLLFAPNPDLVDMLTARTGVPCHLMERGIDIDTFSPLHRTRCSGTFVIGFVGRLSVEKNIRMLTAIHRVLHARGIAGYRFLVVGDGSEREWLRDHLPGAELPGILRGRALAEAYANMDAFVFPSETDTFGNVVQEALASGVPCIVSARGGPRFLIREGDTGFVAATPEVYADRVAALMADASLRRRMQASSRRAAEGRTWEAVFEGVYSRYSGYFPPQTKSLEIVSPNLHQKCNVR